MSGAVVLWKSDLAVVVSLFVWLVLVLVVCFLFTGVGSSWSRVVLSLFSCVEVFWKLIPSVDLVFVVLFCSGFVGHWEGIRVVFFGLVKVMEIAAFGSSYVWLLILSFIVLGGRSHVVELSRVFEPVYRVRNVSAWAED